MRAIALCALGALLLATPALAADPDLQQRVASFLDAYASGDKSTVEAALEPGVRFYGSDVAETYSGLDGFGHMFDNDMKLWGDGAKFGQMRDVSTVRDGNLETIFFNVPFRVGAWQAITTRFAMVWHLDNGTWKLVQESNTVPTVGQSGDERLKAKPEQ